MLYGCYSALTPVIGLCSSCPPLTIINAFYRNIQADIL